VSDAAAERLQDWGAEIGIVLGSGLSSLVDDLPSHQRIPYSDFAGLAKPTVPGHQGAFVLSDVNDKRVIYAQGRVHLYEAHSARAVTAGVRLLASCGIRRLILTNAAGSANPSFEPGNWMMIRDHLNLTGTTPLLTAPQFIDMTDAYSPSWSSDFAAAARERQMTLYEGVYAGVLGPQYETPAEVRMLRQMGADAIGMSTVLETIQARALGLEVVAFSCLTNWAVGVGADHLSHEHVLATGKAASSQFARLLKRAL
jgi:purine-nucleoside phosphorylase